jgi:SAM-dependent methyltransferase
MHRDHPLMHVDHDAPRRRESRRMWVGTAAIFFALFSLPLCGLALRAAPTPAAAPHEPPPADDRATATHRFDNAEEWAKRFEDPARDAWQKPDSVVAALVDRDDLVIVDIGSATGYFPVRFARAVPRGRVYGADVEPAMIYYLNDRARREGLPNLVSVLAAPDDPHLPESVDLVFICDTYHHIDHRIAYFERLKATLRPQARVAVLDWRMESPHGPPHKLPRENVLREMQSAGYSLAHEYTFLPDQYFLVFAVPQGR